MRRPCSVRMVSRRALPSPPGNGSCSRFPSMAILDAEGKALQKGVGRNLYAMSNAVSYAPAYAAMKAKVDPSGPPSSGRDTPSFGSRSSRTTNTST